MSRNQRLLFHLTYNLLRTLFLNNTVKYIRGGLYAHIGNANEMILPKWRQYQHPPDADGGRPEGRPSGERSRRRANSTLVASHDARVHSPLPWCKCSLLPIFPPALLNTTRPPRVSYPSLLSPTDQHSRLYAHPSPPLQLDNLTRSRQPPSAFGPENCESLSALPRTAAPRPPPFLSTLAVCYAFCLSDTQSSHFKRIVLSYLLKISERYADNKVCGSW